MKNGLDRKEVDITRNRWYYGTIFAEGMLVLATVPMLINGLTALAAQLSYSQPADWTVPVQANPALIMMTFMWNFALVALVTAPWWLPFALIALFGKWRRYRAKRR